MQKQEDMINNGPLLYKADDLPTTINFSAKPQRLSSEKFTSTFQLYSLAYRV